MASLAAALTAPLTASLITCRTVTTCGHHLHRASLASGLACIVNEGAGWGAGGEVRGCANTIGAWPTSYVESGVQRDFDYSCILPAKMMALTQALRTIQTRRVMIVYEVNLQYLFFSFSANFSFYLLFLELRKSMFAYANELQAL